MFNCFITETECCLWRVEDGVCVCSWCTSLCLNIHFWIHLKESTNWKSTFERNTFESLHWKIHFKENWLHLKEFQMYLKEFHMVIKVMSTWKMVCIVFTVSNQVRKSRALILHVWDPEAAEMIVCVPGFLQWEDSYWMFLMWVCNAVS